MRREGNQEFGVEIAKAVLQENMWKVDQYVTGDLLEIFVNLSHRKSLSYLLCSCFQFYTK